MKETLNYIGRVILAVIGLSAAFFLLGLAAKFFMLGYNL